jgi:LPXTG-motif cell wall-anchored protein
MFRALQMVIPAVVIYTTLFGALGRGNPPPGGVALFLRVGVVGALLAGGVWYIAEKTSFIGNAWMGIATNTYWGLAVGAAALLLMGAFGVLLKRRDE